MENFRHNLSPVEIKFFLKTVTNLEENLFIYCCYKVPGKCPNCGQNKKMCKSGAVSLYSGSFDKITHEISVCLRCGYIDLTNVLTCERL
ncbi:MAG: hypothetical protein A2Y80_08640 [Deltaproteobacteria bacterium RBG_13_58_19]|nr:MAG: hypothetical protein A2Y80_08640 [Deltaproteobacteria bacterium RBG_13_58_19]